VATLTALVITRDEAERIAACLESVRWADEIVVVDSGSTDQTCAIARRYTDKVLFNPWPGYSAQKNFGQGLASCEWILSIDADERATTELQKEIRLHLGSASGDPCDAYRVPIRNWMFGKFVGFGSWGRERPVRLYRMGRATWSGRIHEGLEVQGTIGQLTHPLLHYSHTSIGHFLGKLNTYTELEAEELFKKGVHPGLVWALLGAGRAFLGQYVRLQGFRDGGHGLILAVLMAFYFFATRAKLWSLWYGYKHRPER
jgi:glycosyltransferase involved in cell wall biosynthesis